MFITKKQKLKFYLLHIYQPIIMTLIMFYFIFQGTNAFGNRYSILKYFGWVLWTNIIFIVSLRINLTRYSRNINPLYIYIYHSNFFIEKIGYVYKENENFHMYSFQGKLSLDDLDKSFKETDKLISKNSIKNKVIYTFKLAS